MWFSFLTVSYIVADFLPSHISLFKGNNGRKNLTQGRKFLVHTGFHYPS